MSELVLQVLVVILLFLVVISLSIQLVMLYRVRRATREFIKTSEHFISKWKDKHKTDQFIVNPELISKASLHKNKP